MTAYNSDPRQTDDTPCITANGFDVCKHGIEDTVAANFLKFGTKVMIPELFGDRVFVVRDRMNKRYPNRVDVWLKDYDDAIKFGVRVATIHVIE
jgi:3D (Asp-Asp-Asp) domain-containing protein